MNVLFDFGNVLYDFDYGRFFRAVAPHSAISETRLRSLLFEGEYSAAYRFETGATDPDDFLHWIREEAGIDLPLETIRHQFINIFSPHEPGIAVARECAEQTRIGLISNTNRLHFDGYMRHVPLFNAFSTVVLSFEVGSMKPDEELFRRAIEQLNCPPDDCVFIDDLAENVAGAEKFGMLGIHYLPGTDLRSEVMYALNR